MDSLWQELEVLFKEYYSVFIFILLFFCIWFVTKFANDFILLVKNLYPILKKIIKFLLKGLVFPLQMFLKSIVWIFTIKQRHDYRQEVLSSPYNVYPEYFKIPLWRRIFSYRIRQGIRNRFHCIEKCIETQSFLDTQLKYINLIETSVGGGKTSLMSCLSHSRTIFYRDEIDEKIDNTQKIMYQVNWDEVNKDIIAYYQEDTYIPKIVDKLLSDEKYDGLFEGFYDNYRQETPRKILLKDYVTAFCADLRNHYVMSNYILLNRITENFSIDFKNNALNIKDPEVRKTYYLPSYCFLIEDEIALGTFKNTTNFYDQDDLGKDSALRLIRQLKDETLSYIGASQNISRTAKLTRELGNTYFIIESLEKVGLQNRYSEVFLRKEERLKKEYERKLTKNKVLKKDYKKEIFDAYQMQNKIFASGFVRYKISYTHSFKDLDLNKKDLPVYELYFPLTWAFGTYLKCEFNGLDQYLNDKSQHSDQDLDYVEDFYKEKDSKFYEDILLNKRVEKEKEKQRLKDEKMKSKGEKEDG